MRGVHRGGFGERLAEGARDFVAGVAGALGEIGHGDGGEDADDDHDDEDFDKREGVAELLGARWAEHTLCVVMLPGRVSRDGGFVIGKWEVVRVVAIEATCVQVREEMRQHRQRA